MWPLPARTSQASLSRLSPLPAQGSPLLGSSATGTKQERPAGWEVGPGFL